MKLPNLELLAYKAELMLYHDEDFKERSRRFEEIPYARQPLLRASVFTQVWSSTALEFDYEMGGQAITEAYTTVFHEEHTGFYVVFFGDKACYMVKDANEAFFKGFEKS